MLRINNIIGSSKNRISLNILSAIIPKLYYIVSHIFTSLVIDYYGADYKWGDESSHRVSRKTGNLGFGLLFYAFARVMRVRRILVIGSMYGFIPFMGAEALKEDNLISTVDFIDPGYDIKNTQDRLRHNMGQGIWKKTNAKNYFSFLGVERKINHFLMTSEDFANKYPANKYDLIWIDGDHSFKGGMKDFTLFWPKLKRNGFIFFHDIAIDKIYENGIIKVQTAKVWKELTKKINYKFVLSGSSGLGILQKN